MPVPLNSFYGCFHIPYSPHAFRLPKFKDKTREGARGRRRTRNTKINTKAVSLQQRPLKNLPNLLDNGRKEETEVKKNYN